MSPVILACVLAACLISQVRVGATLEPSTDNPPTPTDLCQLSPYNIKNLTREEFWSANNVSSSTGSRGFLCFDPAATSCTFYFAFCHPIEEVNYTACQGAAVCQVSKNPNGTLSGYSMGQFSNTTQFYETNGTVAGSFYVDVVNGSANNWDSECAKNSTGASTRIVLECNSTVQWNSQDLTDIINVKYSEPCSYTITIPYAGACRPSGPTTTSPNIMPTSTTSSPTSTSHSVKPTSPGPSNNTVTTRASTATASPSSPSISPSVSTSSTHAGSSSSMGPNPTVTPGPHPPTTTNPENQTTTREGPTDHPTTPERPTTHEHNPSTQPNTHDSHVIHGLIAGIVIFALISVVLLVLLIFAGRVIYTKAGPYRRVSNNDDM